MKAPLPHLTKLAAALALLTVALTGCALPTQEEPHAAPGPSDASTGVPEDSPPPEEGSPPEEASPSTSAALGPYHVGQSCQYPDGLKVALVSLARYRPGEFTTVPAGQTAVLMNIRYTAGKAAFDVGLRQIEVRSGAAGNSVSELFDTNLPVLSGNVLPARSATEKLSYGIPSAELGMISVEIDPSFDHDSCIFEAKLA